MHLFMYYTKYKKYKKNTKKKLYNTIYAFIYKYYPYIVILLITSFYYSFNCMRLSMYYIQKTKTTQKQEKTKQHKKLYNTIYAFIYWK